MELVQHARPEALPACSAYKLCQQCVTICTLLHVQVTLEVLDANDNSPVFSSDLVVFQTAENQTAPLEIGSVVATDVDEGNLSNMACNHST